MMDENSTSIFLEWYNFTMSLLNSRDNVTELLPTVFPPTPLPWQDLKDNFARPGYVILPTFLVIGLMGKFLDHRNNAVNGIPTFDITVHPDMLGAI